MSEKMQELDEITSHILLFQVFSSNGFADTLSLPQMTQTMDSSIAVNLDDRLAKLESSHENFQHESNMSVNARHIIFRLR